jgi:hypothetical protein
MPLIFKLVGFVINNKYFQINDPYEGDINLVSIHILFKTWGLTDEELQEVKFIIDSEQITDINKIYHINQNEKHNIFVFVFNQDIRQKLQNIFTTHGTGILSLSDKDSDDDINHPITQIENEKIILTHEVIHTMNDQTLILFSDSDFISLLDIYKRKPGLFNILSNYIQNNDLIESLITDKSIDQLSEQEKEYYTNLSIQVMNLNLNIPQNVIIEKLIKYSGHLNLTIRSILNELNV